MLTAISYLILFESQLNKFCNQPKRLTITSSHLMTSLWRQLAGESKHKIYITCK